MALPQILVRCPPLRFKRITVNIDRPGFMFNPTNCGAPGQPGAQQVTAVLSGSQNATMGTSPSQVRGRRLFKALAFQTVVRGLHERQDKQSGRREPRREAVLPRGVARQRGEHPRAKSKSNCPEAAALAA